MSQGSSPAAQQSGRSGDIVTDDPVDIAFRWTPIGISLSSNELSLTADGATLANDGGQRSLITVRWGDQLCHRQRVNLDDPCQRAGFVKKLLLSCRQAGMRDDVEPLSIIAARVTPALLIRLAEECRRRPEESPTDTRATQILRTRAEKHAAPLLHDPNILDRIAEAMRASGYAGKLEPAVLAYVALTSRFLEHPLNLAFVADPAAGKSATIDAALKLIPPEAVYVFTASSPTALIYKEENLQNRFVIFREADSIPDRGPAAAAIRALAEDSLLRYEVTIRGRRRTGGLETWKIEKVGPTGLMTTSTRPLAPQLHTRLLSVRIVNTDDRVATLDVLCAKGKRAAGIWPAVDIERFLAFQRWLAVAGERRVIVPFGPALAEAMGYCSLELRTRRDFEALLSCVKTIAFIYQRHRKSTPDGEIEATLDDYHIARRLLVDSFSVAAAEGLTSVICELVVKIRPNEEVTRTELGERLARPRSTLYHQVARALELELLSEEKKAGKRFLRRDRPLPDEQLPLPHVEDVEDFFFGVPSPRWSEALKKFVSDFAQVGSPCGGITATEWAVRVGQPVEVVRQRLDALVEANTLTRHPQTGRYAVNSQMT